MSKKTENFINSIAPIIASKAKEHDYLVCSPMIAQVIIESYWGDSLLAKKYNNYFGMKCGSAWKGKSVNLSTKEEYTKGTLTSIKDNFRVYDSLEDGIEGYFTFINTSRYKALKKCSTPLDYLTAIKDAGYCTSSTYIQNCMSIIRQYKLYLYDSNNKKYSGSLPEHELSYGDTGLEVRYLKEFLNWYHNTNILSTNSMKFGTNTMKLLRMFQILEVLPVDGVCKLTDIKRMREVEKK